MKKSTRTITRLAMLIALLTVSTSCMQTKRINPSGNYVTKDIKVEDFSSIALIGSEDVTYTQSTDGKYSVKVYTSDNIFELLDIKTEKGCLQISLKEGFTVDGFNNPIKVIVSSPNVDELNILGSGNFTFKGPFKTDKLSLSILGSGDINGANLICNKLETSVKGSGNIKVEKVIGKEVDADIMGSGDIVLTGTSEASSFNVIGSGNINAGGLKSEVVKATSTGSGDISCHAIKTLKPDITGSGNINYKGKPAVETSDSKNLHDIK